MSMTLQPGAARPTMRSAASPSHSFGSPTRRRERNTPIANSSHLDLATRPNPIKRREVFKSRRHLCTIDGINHKAGSATKSLLDPSFHRRPHGILISQYHADEFPFDVTNVGVSKTERVITAQGGKGGAKAIRNGQSGDGVDCVGCEHAVIADPIDVLPFRLVVDMVQDEIRFLYQMIQRLAREIKIMCIVAATLIAFGADQGVMGFVVTDVINIVSFQYTLPIYLFHPLQDKHEIVGFPLLLVPTAIIKPNEKFANTQRFALLLRP